jgi:hypothetical protein
MKLLLSLALVLLIASGLFAQENSNQSTGKDEIKLSKKEQRKALQQKLFDEKEALLNSKQFVLEADYFITRQGNRISVPSSINFIMVDSTDGIVQLGANSGMGANGVGGVTAKGKISGWVLEPDLKRKSFSLRYNVNSTIGFFTVTINIPIDGKSIAFINGSAYFSQFDYHGKLVPLSESSTFKGRSL